MSIHSCNLLPVCNQEILLWQLPLVKLVSVVAVTGAPKVFLNHFLAPHA